MKQTNHSEKIKLWILAVFAPCMVTFAASASVPGATSGGLVIHTAEFGVGKFHRYDNQVHAYDQKNAWTPYILPQGAETDKALVVKNKDGSYTVFFSTLDEMMTSVASISQKEAKRVSVLNIHGHGLPGGMWFPKDEASLNDSSCEDWRQAASGADVDNYKQYYGQVTSDEIMQIRAISNLANFRMPCTTGATEWRAAVVKHPEFKSSLESDSQLHFLSCVVGLGSVGDQFTKQVASILALGTAGHVETSIAFGLGDWSMPEGMGFWDFQSAQQVDDDNAKYPVDRKDREIAQKGSIRLASFAGGQWSTQVLESQDFMSLGFESNLSPAPQARNLSQPWTGPLPSLPLSVRVPGTNSYVKIEAQ